MNGPPYETQLERLWDAVQALSLAPERQLEVLDQIGASGLVDELALQFADHFWAAEPACRDGKMSRTEYELLKKLDACLKAVSGPEHADIWTPAALRVSHVWKRVRALAAEALAGRQAGRT